MRADLDRIVERYRTEEGSVISLLQDIQEEFGYIPQDDIAYVASRLDIPLSRFFGTATFYSQFYLAPRGKNIVSICCGTACHVKGGTKIADRVQKDLGLSGEGETTSDGLFTVEVVRCVGACSIAPVVIVNAKAYGDMTSERMLRLIKSLRKEETGAEK